VLGDEFTPPVHDLATAVYFSIVSMSTVGYGDIVPHAPTARLFTASVIVADVRSRRKGALQSLLAR
jgi:voltage-gated potassium channel